MKIRRCGNCGSFDIKKMPTNGPFPWKDYPKVFLISPISLHQCQVCGEQMGPLGEGDKIDKAIEGTIKSLVRYYIESIMKREKCKQVDLAEHLGLTPEHLSALKRGVKIPCYHTFMILKTLTGSEQAFQIGSPNAKVMPPNAKMLA